MEPPPHPLYRHIASLSNAHPAREARADSLAASCGNSWHQRLPRVTSLRALPAALSRTSLCPARCRRCARQRRARAPPAVEPDQRLRETNGRIVGSDGVKRHLAARDSAIREGSPRLVRTATPKRVSHSADESRVSKKSEPATKEPRGLHSAAGEVELPPRGPEAARTQREHELQGDAEGPRDAQRHPRGHVPQDAQCPRERPSLTAEGELRGDRPYRRTPRHTKQKRPSESPRMAVLPSLHQVECAHITRRRPPPTRPV